MSQHERELARSRFETEMQVRPDDIDMKLSELATAYDQMARAGSDPARVKILAEILRNADASSLPIIPRFTLAEIVRPELSEMLGIGPATIRGVLAELTGRTVADISR